MMSQYEDRAPGEETEHDHLLKNGTRIDTAHLVKPRSNKMGEHYACKE